MWSAAGHDPNELNPIPFTQFSLGPFTRMKRSLVMLD
jgi:hypothetical protein